MNFLSIDTTMDSIAIAIDYKGKKITQTGNESKKKHNSTLLTAIENILFENNIGLEDMDVLGVVTGPGSFTGIRVGVATINAMSFALNKPVVEITALFLAKVSHPEEDILALIDCRHNNYYAGYFKGDDVEYFAINGDEIKRFPAKNVLIEKPNPEALYLAMKEKIAKKEFSPKAKPFYLKKSSAERENEK